MRKVSPFKVLRTMDWQQTTGGGLMDIPSPPEGRRFTTARRRLGERAGGRVGPQPGHWQTVQGDRPRRCSAARASPACRTRRSSRLANQTKKDLWINIPDRATMNYVTQLGSLLNSELTAPVKVYVEFSNELWDAGEPAATGAGGRDQRSGQRGPLPDRGRHRPEQQPADDLPRGGAKAGGLQRHPARRRCRRSRRRQSSRSWAGQTPAPA